VYNRKSCSSVVSIVTVLCSPVQCAHRHSVSAPLAMPSGQAHGRLSMTLLRATQTGAPTRVHFSAMADRLVTNPSTPDHLVDVVISVEGWSPAYMAEPTDIRVSQSVPTTDDYDLGSFPRLQTNTSSDCQWTNVGTNTFRAFTQA
jgi:hypothetical protein